MFIIAKVMRDCLSVGRLIVRNNERQIASLLLVIDWSPTSPNSALPQVPVYSSQPHSVFDFIFILWEIYIP